MRRRLTREGLFRRTAAPDEFSGRNMNTPIIIYDTHPNARFPIGSVVTFVDDTYLRLRGTVLGHAAEDRLWVQWPNEVRQMDTDEVVNNDEIQDGGSSSPIGVIGSRRSREATRRVVSGFTEKLKKAGFRPGDYLTGYEAVQRLGVTEEEWIQAKKKGEIVRGESGGWEIVPSTQFGVVGSRRPRNATLITFDDIDRYMDHIEHEEEDEDLEYIPDVPDFLDGDPVITDDHPTNETHTGELPSDQDPRDKIEEEDDNGCEGTALEFVLEIIDPADMTDLIEDHITASRREALFGYKKEKTKDQVLKEQKEKYGSEAKAALNYNLFEDPEVVLYLRNHGLHEDEISNFYRIRKHQLEEARQRAYLGQGTRQYGKEQFQKTPEYKWGQGTGIQYGVGNKEPAGGGAPQRLKGLQHHPNVKTPEARAYVINKLIPALQRNRTIPGVNPEITKYYYQQLMAAKARQKAPAAEPAMATR